MKRIKARRGDKGLFLRLPQDLKDEIARRAECGGRSQNSQALLLLRKALLQDAANEVEE